MLLHFITCISLRSYFQNYTIYIYGFFSLLDGQGPVCRSSEHLLDFLTVIIIAIICLAAVINCHTSSTCGVRRNAGRVSGRETGRGLSVKQEKRHIWLPMFLLIIVSLCVTTESLTEILFVCSCVTS